MFLTITFLLWNKHWNNSTSQKKKCQYSKNSGKEFTLIYGWSPALIFRVNKMLIDFLNIIMIWICYFIHDFRSDKKGKKKRDLTILWILDTFLSTGFYKMYLPFNLHTLARIKIGANRILCTKIMFSPREWFLYKDCYLLGHLRYKNHWRDLSNEVLHEVLFQRVSELSQVKVKTSKKVPFLSEFKSVKVWPLVFQVPINEKFHAVPHLKALINIIYTSSEPRDGSLYIKTLILVHKMQFAPIFILASVL